MVALVREDVDLVMCGRYDNFPDGSKTPFLPNPRLDEKTVAQHPRLISGTSQFIWDKLYRAQVVHQHTIRFDEHLKYAEDCLFLTQFKLQCNRVRVVREALYNYAESSDGSITKQCNEDWFDIIESMKKLVNFVYARGYFLSYWQELEKLSLGYYGRRLRSLYKFGNKKNQLRFFSDYMAFLDQYFPRWRRISPGPVYRNKVLLSAYIVTPNAVKKAIRALHITRKKLKRKRVLYAYFRKYLPLKRNQALFISYSGAGVGDSPLYMAAQLAQVGQHDIVFASRSLARDRLFCRLNGLNLTLVNVRSWEYIRRLASSEYVITNSRVPTYFNKREGQVLVNTWHGTPLKTLGTSMQSGLADVGRNQNQFLMSDYLLYPNRYSRDHMMQSFNLDQLYTGNVVVAGYPRNDAFLGHPVNRLHRFDTAAFQGKKVFLYMPTWRGKTVGTIDGEHSVQELTEILSHLNAALDDNHLILLKLHQSVGAAIDVTPFEKIRLVPELHDTYDILALADGLITDYSSIMFDFLYAHKPIILFLYDLAAYTQTRGFYFDITETPFTQVATAEALAQTLNQNSYAPSAAYDTFRERFCESPEQSFSQDLNALIFQQHTQEDIAVTPSAAQAWRVYLCDQETVRQQPEKLAALAAEPDNLLVFHEHDIDGNTEAFLQAHPAAINACVIAPGEMPITIGEKLVLLLFEKFGVLVSAAQKIYQQEIYRLLANVKIKSIHNLSRRKKFQQLGQLFNDGVTRQTKRKGLSHESV